MTTFNAPTAPYAPIANVLTVIRWRRERELPEVISARVLDQIGVPESNTSRTMLALRYLGLIDDENRRTETFERLRLAGTDEYPTVLAEVIRAAYHAIFTIIDPSRDDRTAIDDAFRQCEPAAQRERMVTMFLGLCREAGIVSPETPRRTQSNERRQPRARQPGQRRQEEAEARSDVPDYRIISALIQQLPRDSRWTKERRDKWLQAFTSAVDLIVKVTESE